jgi:hypothetical protein
MVPRLYELALSVRMTPAERRAIEAAAKAARLSMSRFLVACALSSRAPEAPHGREDNGLPRVDDEPP